MSTFMLTTIKITVFWIYWIKDILLKLITPF